MCEGEGKNLKSKEKSKNKNPNDPKVPKACTRAKHRKLVYQVLKTRNQRHIPTVWNLHRRFPLTPPGTMVGTVTTRTVVRVLMSGMMTRVQLDGTKVGNKRMIPPQAHFHLEFRILVPPFVRSGFKR